jgi:hypothetical protein
MSAAWGHGFHQGLEKGRVEGGVAGLVITGAVTAGVWAFVKLKTARIKRNETSDPATPSDDA